MKNLKIILISILIGLIAFPTITLGGTFVSSLIQGKSVEESVKILAEQLDALIGRVEILEEGQKKQGQYIEKLEKEQEVQEAYNEFRKVYDRVWLYSETEEKTVNATIKACEDAIEKGNQGRIDAWCPIARDLERTWNAYQKALEQ